MKIALDYDGTVTEDPELWFLFVELCKRKGHDVRVVTFRANEDVSPDLAWFSEKADIHVVYTSREFKKPFCEKFGWVPDVWIDDNPGLIGQDVEAWSQKQYDEWKENLPDRVAKEPEGAGNSELPTLNTV